ncbi:MAG: dTDP-4-dehydrorhamnose 3,5-epimerase [Rhodospirillales bacterium]|nr:dTDP-4-dehydrorhamnose 3,5-epimerase [Rhodospirillales bacterium]
MRVEQTSLPGVLVIEPKVFGDSRGFFLESYHQGRYAGAGIDAVFVQDNHSRSSRGVLRGLHYQIRHPQGKLVSVVSGEVFDVAVDIRRGSPHFGKWYGCILSADNHRQLWVPPGFAHGFCTLSETADFLYKCTDYYHPEDEGGVLWNDRDLAIAWPVESPALSAKDAVFPALAMIEEERLPAHRD